MHSPQQPYRALKFPRKENKMGGKKDNKQYKIKQLLFTIEAALYTDPDESGLHGDADYAVQELKKLLLV